MTFGAFQGQLRPLVEAAWKNHAGLYGVSDSDREERETFYRTHLWVACRLRSTKEADERQRVALIAYFRDLTPAPAPTPVRPNVARIPGIRVDHWSDAQQAAFFRLARTAYAAARARNQDDDLPLLETWLATTMQEAFNANSVVSSMTGMWVLGDRTKGFDQAMGALAVIAADRYWMDRTAEGSERRLRWQLARFLEDLSWLEGREVDWGYVCGIHRQAHHGLPVQVEDATTVQLYEIIDMLDSHIRRLCERRGVRPCHCPTRRATGSSDESLLLQREWSWFHHPSPGHTRAPNGRFLQEKGVA